MVETASCAPEKGQHTDEGAATQIQPRLDQCPTHRAHDRGHGGEHRRPGVTGGTAQGDHHGGPDSATHVDADRMDTPSERQEQRVGRMSAGHQR